MKTRSASIFVGALLGLTLSVLAADFDPAEFARATRSLASYRYGSNQVDPGRIEALVASAASDADLRPRVEQRLLEILREASTNDASQFICRLLRTIGTGASVATLEPMLFDPELSHMARYALGRIEGPEAGQALQRALERTSGSLQVGIINTLGQRRDLEASRALAKRTLGEDREVAVAAIQALGRLGDDASLAALRRVRAMGPGTLGPEIDDALLSCAEALLDRGETDRAVSIYGLYYPNGASTPLRVAGLRGLAKAKGDSVVDLLRAACRSEDAMLRANAIGLLGQVEGRETTRSLLELYSSVPVDSRELVVRTLAEREEDGVLPMLIRASVSPDEQVRRAAYEALGRRDRPEVVVALAKAAGAVAGAEQRLARANLVRLQGPAVDRAMIEGARGAESPARIEIIRAIGQRNLRAAFPVLRQIAVGDTDSAARREAILGLGMLGEPSDLSTLVGLVVEPKEAEDRPAAERAVLLVFGRMRDRDAQAGPVIASLDGAPSGAKPMLLGLLSRPATAPSLAAVRNAVDSDDPIVSRAAVATLGEWPTADPAEDLYRIAASASDPKERVLALRGYVRMAPLAAEPTEIYLRAMRLARSDEDRKLVLGGLGNADTLEALELAEKYLAEPSLKDEAAQAAVKVASVYCWTDPKRATATLERIARETPHEHLRRQAREAIQRMEDYQGYIYAWKAAGPYKLDEVNEGRKVFETPFPPEENPEDPDIRWVSVKPVFEGDKRLNLEATFGRVDYCCAYLRTTIWSPSRQEVKIHWSVDDFIKGWINGEATSGGTVSLRRGENTFMLKVGDHGGGWNFNCRLLGPDDAPVGGLRFEPR